MPSAPTYDYIVEQPVKRAPPCCKISFCRNACEYSKPCVKCGGCGAMPQTSRKGAMGCTLCLAVIALILSIFPILGLSKSAGLIKAFPWATADPSYSNLLLLQYQSDPSEKVFIGSSAIVNQTVSGDEIVTAYSDSDCGSQYVEVQPACRDCEDAAGSVAVTTIISFLANIGSVCSAASRLSDLNDLNYFKFMGALTNTLSAITTTITLISFASRCKQNLPTSLTVGVTVITFDNRLGVSWMLTLVCAVLSLLQAVLHCLMPAPLRERAGHDFADQHKDLNPENAEDPEPAQQIDLYPTGSGNDVLGPTPAPTPNSSAH